MRKKLGATILIWYLKKAVFLRLPISPRIFLISPYLRSHCCQCHTDEMPRGVYLRGFELPLIQWPTKTPSSPKNHFHQRQGSYKCALKKMSIPSLLTSSWDQKNWVLQFTNLKCSKMSFKAFKNEKARLKMFFKVINKK